MMKRILAVLALLAIGGALFAWAGKKIYPDRWVYVSRSFDSDRDVEGIRNIARTASEHGLTGIVLAGMDRISLGTPAYYDRLKQVKEIADSDRLEIIPLGFGTGYGGAILSHDKNLAEGMLVQGALFVAGQTEARFRAESPARLLNGGFEQFNGNTIKDFSTQDQPGVKTFVDTHVFHWGKASLRIENFGGAQEENVRLVQQIRVTPNRCYRVRAWVKTEGAAPASLFSIKAYTADHRDLSPFEPRLGATSDWTQVSTAFNSWYADRIDLNVGVFEGLAGKVWVDDV